MATIFAGQSGYLGEELISAAGDREEVKHLLNLGADPTYKNNRAYRVACAYGWRNVVENLLKSGADPHANKDEGLINAAGEGKSHTITAILESGAYKAEEHWPALQRAIDEAARRGRDQTVTIIQHYAQQIGATLTPTTGYSKDMLTLQILDTASYGSHQDVEDLLRVLSDEGRQALLDLRLINAAPEGSFKLTKQLLKPHPLYRLSADPTAWNSAALVITSRRNNVQNAALLLNANADLSVFGYMPILTAAAYGPRNMMEILLDRLQEQELPTPTFRNALAKARSLAQANEHWSTLTLLNIFDRYVSPMPIQERPLNCAATINRGKINSAWRVGLVS